MTAISWSNMAAQTLAITFASQMESLPVIRKEKGVKKGGKSHMILLLIFYWSELDYMATVSYKRG